MMSIQWTKLLMILLFGQIFVVGCRFGQRPLPTPAPLATQQSETGVQLSEAVSAPSSNEQTFIVQRGEIATQLNFSGRVTLEREQELYFEQNGRLKTVYVENGDFVDADTLLAELDIEDRLVDLATAELEVKIVQEQISKAGADRAADQELASERLRMAEIVLAEMLAEELAAPGTVETSQLAQSEFEVTQSKLALERIGRTDDLALQKELLQAEGRVRSLQSEISKSRIFAPYAGKVRFITNISNQAGNLIEEYIPVLSILDLNSLQIESYPTIPQQDLLLEDMAVEIQIPYRPGTSIPATIKYLPYPQGSGVETFTQIEVGEESYDMLRVGAAVEIMAAVVHTEDSLWVQPSALRGFGSSRFVVIADGTERKEVEVRLGVQTEERVEILSGVEEGQVVVGR